MDRKLVDKCLRDFDWPALEHHLDVVSAELNPDYLIEHIELNDRVMEKFVTPKLAGRRAARTVFFEKLAAYLKVNYGEDNAEAVTELAELFVIIEDGYHKIWADRLTGPSGTLTPEQRVSGTFQVAAKTICELHEFAQDYFANQKTIGNVIELTDKQGNPVNPDASIEIVCEVATATLQAEGRAHNWIAGKDSPYRKGTIVLPALEPINAKQLNASQSCAYNALFWRNWRLLEQQKRFLGGHLEFFSIDADEAAKLGQYPHHYEYWPENSELEFADMAANERWKRQLFQTFIEMTAKFGVGDYVVGLEASAALPPKALLSEAEILTIDAFCETLSRNITEETIQYEGLRLVEWIRGYAVLREYIDESFNAENPQSLLPVKPREYWIDLLHANGLTRAKADILLHHLTFNQDSRDIYDNPFVALSDGSLCLFGPAVRSSEIYTILNSTLNKLEVDFAEKGKAFEERILDKLNSFPGVDAKTFETRRNGEQYQFDILMRFDGHIFLIELKNRSLSYGVPQRVFRHMQRTVSDVKQTQRLNTALEDYPDILNTLFGQGASDLPRHACLTYSKPYSVPGGLDGVYVFDVLALIRFFDNRYLSLTSARKAGSERLIHAHNVADIWNGDQPTANVLLREMEDPFQVGTLRGLIKSTGVIGEFDKTQAFIRHESSFKPQTGHETCDYFGTDYDALMAEIGVVDDQIDVLMGTFPNLKASKTASQT